jgi:DNA-binding CsgD family transcriptional regulator
MKSKTLLRVVEMARSGCTDREIGKAVGAAPSTISYHRKKAGIERDRGQTYRTLYALYDRDGQYLFEGSVKECANFLEIQEHTVREYLSRFRAGKKTPVEIYAEPVRRMT